MRTFVTAIVVAIAIVGASSASHAAVFAPDSYTCFKAKDLKNPLAVAPTPNPAAVTAYQSGNGNCTLGTIAQVCMPSNVNMDVATNAAQAYCCFKAKCDKTIGPVSKLNVNDDAGGAATYSLDVGLTKAATVCMPCDYVP